MLEVERKLHFIRETTFLSSIVLVRLISDYIEHFFIARLTCNVYFALFRFLGLQFENKNFRV